MTLAAALAGGSRRTGDFAPNADGGSGSVPRVLLNFQYYKDCWSVHLVEEDCRTSIGPKARYYDFATLEELQAFVVRCNPEDLAEFDRSARAWSRGSEMISLTHEQYSKLKQPTNP